MMRKIIDALPTYDSDLLVVSNYFTSKSDPQRSIYQDSNSFDYIEEWYNSVVSYRLNAIILHDGLSSAFIEKYGNEHIHFIACSLGDYSLNDERFILFNALVKSTDYPYYLFTDISDVVFLKDPLRRLKSDGRMHIGLDLYRSNAYSVWFMDKLNELRKIGIKFNPEFYAMPMFCAGVIGGQRKEMLWLLDKMEQLFLKIDNPNNYDMLVLNKVLQERFYQHSMTLKVKGSFLKFLRRFIIKYAHWKNESIIRFHSHSNIDLPDLFSGYPFTNLFKSYNWDENTIIKHK